MILGPASPQVGTRLSDEVVRAADIVSMRGCGDAGMRGCGDAGLTVPGRRCLGRPVTGPEGEPIAVVRAIRNEIDTHITDLLSSMRIT
ncbi:hypothetical protein [Streptomyces sp. NPDC051997]|uniref:hypothetical protein n=2 Tax=unclassified Streptomyces TaxID=2593676 RepID=UPI003443A252